MKIKVCGMRSPENINELVNLELDYIGFIFYPPSSRYVGADFDEEILHSIPGDINKVGVFVNEPEESLLKIGNKYALDFVQLHGSETPEYCRRVRSEGLKIIKAFSVTSDFDFSILEGYNKYCSYFLFDTKTEKHGGSGLKFDWNILSKYEGDIPVFLSGGIDVNDAVTIKVLKIKNLYAVDINSCFEIKPGFKNIKNIKKFIQNIN